MNPNACPRCETEMHHVTSPPPFWVCWRCRTNWTEDELAEARADGVDVPLPEADPFADVREVFFEESARGGDGPSSGNGGRSRKPPKPRPNERVLNDWGLQPASDYASQSRPRQLTTKAPPIKVYVRKQFERTFQQLCERAGVRASDLVRVAVEKKLEKFSENA